MNQDERLHRHEIAKSVFATGNPWLDDALCGGLNSENLMLVAAKTGVGKTFFGVQLAASAARSGKSVHYFALEAERYEIERRRLYYATQKFLSGTGKKMPRYREWLHMKYSQDWDLIETQAEEKLEKEEASLNVIYARGIYTPEMFQMDASELISHGTRPHLIILDHLHHLFLSGDEIEALKTTIHQIKKLKDDLNIPIVVLAQLRKNDAGNTGKRTLPKLEDIRGTASLTDVSTDVLLISQVPKEKEMELPPGIKFPMYFHLAKSRTAPEAKNFVGVVGFDTRTGRYESNYAIAKVSTFDDPELVLQHEAPDWAEHSIFPRELCPRNYRDDL